MKTLKLISEGLILFEDFEDSILNELLINNSDLVINNSFAEMKHGSIYLGTSSFDELVFVVVNDFVPVGEDVGGIKLTRMFDSRELYEYYDVNNNMGALPYIKVVKNGDVFTGLGSNDGETWIEKGNVVYPYSESVGVGVESASIYKVQSLSVYKKEDITIRTLLIGYKVEVYKAGVLVSSAISAGDSVEIQLPMYPFTGAVKIYDELDNLVVDELLVDAWGGDDYSCSLNVDVFDSNGNSLLLNTARHLGNLTLGDIKKKFSIRNNNDIAMTVIIRIADYSPFGDWVTVSKDDSGVPLDFLDEISVTLAANETIHFWVFISKNQANSASYDYKNTECLFYLEVI